MTNQSNDPYHQWKSMYNSFIKEAFNTERKELRNAAMLITALRSELKSIQHDFEVELINIKEQLKQKDMLQLKIKLPNNQLPPKVSECEESDVTTLHNEIIEIESPDLFRVISPNVKYNSSNSVDTSDSFEYMNMEISPTLGAKRKPGIKKYKMKKSNLPKRNISKILNKENTVCVELSGDSLDTSKNCFMTKIRKKKDKPNVTLDETKLEMDPVEDKGLSSKGDASQLGITKLLDMINTSDCEVINLEEDMDSSHEVDEFSKGILFERSPDDVSPKKKLKTSEGIVEPVVRGKARKLLKGFSCAQCIDFYAEMNLSSQHLQQKLDECSKHRYKYRPPEDTLPGMWDMTIPEENFCRK